MDGHGPAVQGCIALREPFLEISRELAACNKTPPYHTDVSGQAAKGRRRLTLPDPNPEMSGMLHPSRGAPGDVNVLGLAA